MTSKGLQAKVFAEDPSLFVSWDRAQDNFQLNITAESSPSTRSEPYNLKFGILPSDET